MNRPRDILFLIADGGHARLVLRVGEHGEFGVVRELRRPHADHRPEVREREEAAFARDVADEVRRVAAEWRLHGVAVVAPAVVMAEVRSQLKGGPPILGELGKDLVNAPEHELGRWLSSLELAAAAA